MSEVYTQSILDKARQYAKYCHESTNHKYDGKPYAIHLQLVYEFGLQYIGYFDEKHQESILAACWTHDVIEDCRQTYNDVKKAVNQMAADITYALTNEKGRNRKERANEKYYRGIISTPFASFVKLCDRMANVKYSKDHNSRMIDVYRNEQPAFKYLLWSREYVEMFAELDAMLNSEQGDAVSDTSKADSSNAAD